VLLATFVKGYAFTDIGTPLELDPFSEPNYIVSSGGVIILLKLAPSRSVYSAIYRSRMYLDIH